MSWPATSRMGFSSRSPGKEQPPPLLSAQEVDISNTHPEADPKCGPYLGTLAPTALGHIHIPDSFSAGEPRVLGLAMVPGHHIVSIEVQRESLAGPPYI
ncbi:N-alpha-acetyltransferase 38, NatC auxiliary subunit [Phyllostomus discolor]|uniref:N-alpha-acetyltransferase 38, NatC auxiliary subunit n=1 Tax=Phyllostomus discolor TaxID=89673 RepID=A0A833ZEV7_9CHIR|nr:N-alpha-acetyltransferase 38, NatC auxiliary subunit [Phyllostomus discolor]